MTNILKQSTQIKHRLQRLKNSIDALPLRFFADKILASAWAKTPPFKLKANHSLPQPLIVNLTSFPPRFEQLHATLKSLLLQHTQPDKLVLWLYEGDMASLPASVLALTAYGLSIETYKDNIRSYKKLVPALQQWPDAFHVTADDDVYYRPDWLTALVSAYRGNHNEVLCLRAHLITRNAQGEALPYKHWQKKTAYSGPSRDLFFTGCSGIFYPPHALHKMTIEPAHFMRLAPYADDIWFYWMTLANKGTIRRVGSNKKIITWPSSNNSSLWAINKSEQQGNDMQFQQVSDFCHANHLIES